MSVALPTLRVGDPVRYQSLSIFPLFSESNGGVDYRLAEEALADESIAVEEVDESGSVPDLLVEEADEFAAICRREDFNLILLVTPTTPRERAIRIARMSTGFLYYVSVTGITGERTQLPPDLADNVAWLRQQTELPICIGFGISSPDHVRLLAPVADGLIVGSAFVRRIAQAGQRSRSDVLQDVGDFAGQLIHAMSGGS